MEIGKKIEYQACSYCAKHPAYADIPPVTLHENGICTICGISSHDRW